MQVRADQLTSHLQKGLRPIYTVWGDEPLLAQEAGDAIRAAARAAGCNERQVHTVAGAHFDWSGLLGASQAMSLFSDKQLIEIRIPSGKPGKDGSEALQRYCEHLGDEVITLVQLPKLDRQQQQAAWFNALDARGRDGAGGPDRAQGAAAVDRAAPGRARPARAGRRSGPAHAWRSFQIGSKATCSPRTRSCKNSPCCTRRVNSNSSRSKQPC